MSTDLRRATDNPCGHMERNKPGQDNHECSVWRLNVLGVRDNEEASTGVLMRREQAADKNTELGSREGIYLLVPVTGKLEASVEDCPSLQFSRSL